MYNKEKEIYMVKEEKDFEDYLDFFAYACSDYMYNFRFNKTTRCLWFLAENEQDEGVKNYVREIVKKIPVEYSPLPPSYYHVPNVHLPFKIRRNVFTLTKNLAKRMKIEGRQRKKSQIVQLAEEKEKELGM